jgi:hypothetical protein
MARVTAKCIIETIVAVTLFIIVVQQTKRFLDKFSSRDDGK